MSERIASEEEGSPPSSTETWTLNIHVVQPPARISSATSTAYYPHHSTHDCNKFFMICISSNTIYESYLAGSLSPPSLREVDHLTRAKGPDPSEQDLLSSQIFPPRRRQQARGPSSSSSVPVLEKAKGKISRLSSEVNGVSKLTVIMSGRGKSYKGYEQVYSVGSSCKFA